MEELAIALTVDTPLRRNLPTLIEARDPQEKKHVLEWLAGRVHERTKIKDLWSLQALHRSLVLREGPMRIAGINPITRLPPIASLCLQDGV